MKQHFKRILTCLLLCAVLAGALPVSASAAEFQDVPDSHWAAASIQQCVEHGFFNGKTATQFGLGQQMTRSAFVVVLCRFFGWETPEAPQTVYPDVAADAWYAGAVETAYAHGAITTQQADFRPADPITREELAVMLVRALGYGSIAGLNQDLALPFEDVTTNAGYITMAYHLGLVNGTSTTTFSPERFATREQVAVILMRLHQKLYQDTPRFLKIVSSAEDLADASVAAIPGGRMISSNLVTGTTEETSPALRDAAQQSGIPALLHIVGSGSALNNAVETSAVLSKAVFEGNYDGLLLDLSQLPESKGRSLTRLATRLKTLLDEKQLYLVCEAPTQNGEAYKGYNYAELTTVADQLVLRIPTCENTSGAFPIAPIAPPEAIDYAVGSLRDTVSPSQITLMLSTSPSAWSGKNDYILSAEDLDALLTDSRTVFYHSERYACPYLVGITDQNKETVVWYLDQDSLSARLQLASLLGVHQICLTD